MGRGKLVLIIDATGTILYQTLEAVFLHYLILQLPTRHWGDPAVTGSFNHFMREDYFHEDDN